MKLIFVLRNPMSRAFSHWNMQRQKLRDLLPFWLAIRTEPERCREASPRQNKAYSYVDRGLYFQQLERYWEHFPKAQTLVLV
jgi:Sulfotransferase domain